MTVARAMPSVPKAGKGPQPRDKNGLNIKLIKKLIIRAFLFFLVSPCAYNRELTTKETIKIGAPIDKILIYLRPLLKNIPSAPKYKNTGLDNKKVISPIVTETNKVITSA